MYIEQLCPDDWKQMATSAHKIVYGKDIANDFERIDFALLIRNDDVPMGFSTIVEIDKYTAYMQDGGAFPSAKMTMFSLRGYIMMVAWLKENYLNIRTHIAAMNKTMIKYALAADFQISGTEFYNDQVYVNFSWTDKRRGIND